MPWFSSRTADEALAVCREAKAPAALVYSPADILADEQFNVRGTIASVPHATLGLSAHAQRALRALAGRPAAIRRPGGDLGEDNDDVLGRYLSLEEQARLRGQGRD